MRKRIEKYKLMHGDIPVVEINVETDEIVLFNRDHLPFALRNKERVGITMVYHWIMDRIDNLNRQNMDKVCQARLTWADKDKIIRDSYGVSFTDNFWINPDNTKITWEEIQHQRDTNAALNFLALTGNLPNENEENS